MKSIFIILVLFLVISCTNKQDDLLGKWRLESIDYSEFLKTIPVDLQKSFRQQIESESDRITGKTFFDFKENDQLELTYPNGQKTLSLKGKWTVSEKADSIFLKKEDPESFKIVKLTEQNLTLKTSDQPQRTIYLEKITD